MRDRFVMKFKNTWTMPIEDVVNKYLDEHPNYRIVCMTYVHQSDVSYGIVAYFEHI